MRYTIDRIEEEIAVVELENGIIIDIPRDILPENSTEGDIVESMILEDEVEKRRKEMDKKFKSLLKKKEK